MDITGMSEVAVQQKRMPDDTGTRLMDEADSVVC